jgi:decaprenylphospho-beta-D-erythro-pentofuranosid-2-ulose 2-reductase
MKKVLIIGATSAMATDVARRYAQAGAALYLIARDHARLETLARDLRVRGAPQVDTALFDALDPTKHAAVLEQAERTLGGIDRVLIAHGTLPDQQACQSAYTESEQALRVNFLSPIAFLTWLANYFETRKSGNITVISSVAGDRGRQSNYVYGAAKGGLTTYLQGLRNRLCSVGVSVTTIKPGFVESPMTQHLPKGPLFVSAHVVGARIYRAMERGESVVYTPFFWRLIMLIILHIPEFVFKRLKL